MEPGEMYSYEGTIAQDIERFKLDYLIVDDTLDSIKAIDWALFIPKGIRSYFARPFYGRGALRAVMILCSLVMGIGTSVGGWRIIKAVGMDMVKLEKYQGFAADLAAGGCLLASSLTGIPVSTTHTKTTAIMGVGSARRFSTVNWNVAKDMIYAWVLTFPGCGLIGYLMGKLFLLVF
jgi:hypothetical protein